MPELSSRMSAGTLSNHKRNRNSAVRADQQAEKGYQSRAVLWSCGASDRCPSLILTMSPTSRFLLRMRLLKERKKQWRRTHNRPISALRG